MQYTVEGRVQNIDFMPGHIAEVLQNVRMILTTPVGTVPLRRTWFMDYSLLDLPIPLARAQLRANIFEAIKRFEPRATVLEINFVENEQDLLEGRMIPSVLIEITN